MSQVITHEQGREILGGRKAFEVVPYEKACNELRNCLSFDDTKYWSDLADAYEAWARIHRDHTVERLARQIRLRASERMGQIALQRRPKPISSRGTDGRITRRVGAKGLLIESGMRSGEADACIGLAKNPAAVEAAVSLPRPPSPSVLRRRQGENLWAQFTVDGMWYQFRATTEKFKALEVAIDAKAHARDVTAVILQARRVYEWLDEFIQNLER